MRTLFIFCLAIIAYTAVAQKATFTILPDKTEVDNSGNIILHVEVVNKSKNDIVILRPATYAINKWRYYSNTIACDDIPMSEMGGQDLKVNYNDFDLLTIPSKSKVEIKVNGKYNGNILACSSKSFEIALIYDASELIESYNGKKLGSDEMEIVAKLTPIKIESKKVVIKVL